MIDILVQGIEVDRYVVSEETVRHSYTEYQKCLEQRSWPLRSRRALVLSKWSETSPLTRLVLPTYLHEPIFLIDSVARLGLVRLQTHNVAHDCGYQVVHLRWHLGICVG